MRQRLGALHIYKLKVLENLPELINMRYEQPTEINLWLFKLWGLFAIAAMPKIH